MSYYGGGLHLGRVLAYCSTSAVGAGTVTVVTMVVSLMEGGY